MIHFAPVSASLWHQGYWSPAESHVSSILFDEYCAETANTAVVYDIGSHVGYYGLLALAHGCKNVVAVEINFYFNELLHLSYRLNNFAAEGKSLKIVEKLVGDPDLCHFNGQSNRKNWGFEGNKENAEDLTVCHPTISLNELIAEDDNNDNDNDNENDSDILYVKLDVEGTELIALQKASNLLQRAQHLMIEITIFNAQQNEADRKSQQDDAASTFSLLRTFNYDLYRSDNDENKLLTQIKDGQNYTLTTEADFAMYVEKQRSHCIKEADTHCQVDVFAIKSGLQWPSRIQSYRAAAREFDVSLGNYTIIEGKTEGEYQWPPRRYAIAGSERYEFDIGVDARNHTIIYTVVVLASQAGIDHFTTNTCVILNLGTVDCGTIAEELDRQQQTDN